MIALFEKLRKKKLISFFLYNKGEYAEIYDLSCDSFKMPLREKIF